MKIRGCTTACNNAWLHGSASSFLTSKISLSRAMELMDQWEEEPAPRVILNPQPSTLSPER